MIDVILVYASKVPRTTAKNNMRRYTKRNDETKTNSLTAQRESQVVDLQRSKRQQRTVNNIDQSVRERFLRVE